LKNQFFDSIIDGRYLEKYISNEDLSEAFNNMSGVDLTQAYKTEKWNSTFQYQICNILGRLSIIEELYKKANERENFMLSTAYSGLIQYFTNWTRKSSNFITISTI
jgi:hypothetical protein